jgi:hypothetical protein
VIAKAAHIGRIIIPFQDRGSIANFSRASKFPQQSQDGESGTAYRAAGSSERRRTAASELAQDHGSIDWEMALARPGRSRRPYLLAPRYVVHTALAKVWDAFRAHAFSTSATIDDTLIFGCVWPLAAAT